jgi:hypothetical protein
LARQENFWFLQCSPDGAAVPWPGHLCLRQVQAGRATAAQQQRTSQRFGASRKFLVFLVQSVIKSKNQKEMQE